MIENKYRHLISEMQCGYIKEKNEISDITLSLFSDLVLILKRRRNGLHLYRDPIPLESLILIDYSSKGKSRVCDYQRLMKSNFPFFILEKQFILFLLLLQGIKQFGFKLQSFIEGNFQGSIEIENYSCFSQISQFYYLPLMINSMSEVIHRLVQKV